MTRTSLFAAGFTSFLTLGVTACGDSAAEDPRGTVHVNVRAPDETVRPAGMACNQQFFTNEYLPADDFLPSETDPGVAAANGENGISVACKVAGSGGYTVDLQISNGTTSFSLQGQLSETGEGTGLNAVVSKTDWFTNALSSRSMNGLGCTVTALGGAYFVKKGTIYAAFDCPVLTSTPDTACRVMGQLFFERCSG